MLSDWIALLSARRQGAESPLGSMAVVDQPVDRGTPRAPSPDSATLAATALVNPVSNPATPKASDWPGWLDGLGQLPSSISSAATVKVGAYRGGAATWNRVKVSAVSDQYLANIKQIFYEMGRFLAFDFQVDAITSVSGTGSSHPLRLFDGRLGGSYAYAYQPGGSALNSDMFFNVNYDLAGTNTNYFRNGYGSHGWQTTWHETGHALGLNHTFDSGTPVGYDNWNYSTMTYTFTGGEPKGWMVGDLAYLQVLYGADPNYQSGATTYSFTDIDEYTPYYSSGGPGGVGDFDTFTNSTLYDAGGNDSCDFSGLGSGIRYDFDNITGTSSVCYLNDFLKTSYTKNGASYAMTGSQTAIAYNTVIEEVIGTGFDDQFLTVSSRAEKVDAGLGDDFVYLPGSSADYTIGNLVSGYQEITRGGTTDLFKSVEYYVFDNSFGDTNVYQISGSAFVLA